MGDCAFVQNYMRWTTDKSEWLSEAYVSYIGGKPDSVHERRTTNLIRSVLAFSDLPIVLVVVDDIFQLPLFWREFPNLLVYKMHQSIKGLPFNVNKVRAMIAARVATG